MADTTSYTVGGTVQADSDFYITRQADADLLRLCRNGTFVYILSPRQLGKSSLMIRTAHQLAEENIRSVVIDLTQLGTQVSAEAWYLGLLAIIEDQLMLSTSVIEWWKAHSDLGITQRLTRFIEEVLLEEVSGSIVIFIDELDTTLNLTFTDDFFASIRYFYQARVRLPQFKRLSFVLIGVATPSDLIRDPTRTPFNIGQRLDMTDFTLEEAMPLAAGFGLPPEEARQLLQWVLHWTGGHPYLTQRLCQIIIEQNINSRWSEAEVSQLVNNTFFGESSVLDNNIQFVRDMLTKRATNQEEVLTTYREIRAARHPVPDQEQSLVKSHLKLSGVVKRQDSALQIRNLIYRTVFDDKWIKEHLPINWAKRLRQAAGLILALLLLALVMSGLAVYAFSQQGEAENQRNIANQKVQEAIVARNSAETRRQEAEASSQQSDKLRRESHALAVALRSQTVTDPELALLLAIEAAKEIQAGQLEDSGEQVESILRQTIQASSLRAVLKGHSDNLQSVNFSPDNRMLVTASKDGTARLWESASGKLLFVLKGHSNTVKVAIFSPDGKQVVTLGADDTIRVWETASGQQIGLIKTYANSIALSPDGRWLVTANFDKTVRLWEVVTGQLVTELKGHEGAVRSAKFSSDGKLIISSSADGTARLWSRIDGKELIVFRGSTDAVDYATLNPDNTKVLTINFTGHVKIWDTLTGKELATLGNETRNFINNGVAFSPDGKLVVTAGKELNGQADYVARLWETDSGKELFVLRGHNGPVTSAIFSPDGKRVITASQDGTAAIWEVSTGQRIAELRGHTYAVTQLAISPDGRYIATASSDNTARLWETKTSLQLAGDQFELLAEAFSPDGKLVATGAFDGTARIWDAQTGKNLQTWHQYPSPITNMIFTKDNKVLITAAVDGYTRLWEIATGRELMALRGSKTTAVSGLALSPDNRYILTSNSDDPEIVRVWDISSGKQVGSLLTQLTGHAFTTYFNSELTMALLIDYRSNKAQVVELSTGKELFVLQGHSAELTNARFSPDGKLIATSSQDGTARLWESSIGKELVALRGHLGPVNSVAFSPNGKFIITAGLDATTYLWEVTSGRELAVLHGHSGEVTSASFSPDGNYIVTTSRDHTAQIYFCGICGSFEQVLSLAKQHVTRELTPEERKQYGLE